MKLLFDCKVQPSVVFAHLSIMEKFVAVHPLIYKALKTGEKEYKIYEKASLAGFIPYKFSYTATINSNPDTKKIVMIAKVNSLVRLYLEFNITASNNGSFIEENCQIKSPLPIKKLMGNMIEKYHDIMFKNIEKSAF